MLLHLSKLHFYDHKMIFEILENKKIKGVDNLTFPGQPLLLFLNISFWLFGHIFLTGWDHIRHRIVSTRKNFIYLFIYLSIYKISFIITAF